MELVNATKMKAGYTMGLKPDGRELLVVVVKGTFKIPKAGEEPELAEEQADLVMADEFTGEPGFSAPKYECDFAPIKPRCDVLLNGSAYAPGGQPARQVEVGLRVGTMAKQFQVVGNRVWKKFLFMVYSTPPEPFTVMPISYDNAFGGVDRSKEEKQRYFLPNHAGRGYHHYLTKKAIHGKPLPNTEEFERPVKNPRGKYLPMAFGVVGRAWQPRPKLAGTYDQNWLDNVFPFLPSDFDDRYYQAAPADQLTDYPRGGEEVGLRNLTPQDWVSFRLPSKLGMPVLFLTRDDRMTEVPAVVDTVLLEPEQRRFMLLWRASLPLRRNIREVRQVTLGRTARQLERERADETRTDGKRRHASLAEVVEWPSESGRPSGPAEKPR